MGRHELVHSGADLQHRRRVQLSRAIVAKQAEDFTAANLQVEPSFDAWDRVGRGRPLVVFEAIGVPGIIDGALRDAPA